MVFQISILITESKKGHCAKRKNKYHIRITKRKLKIKNLQATGYQLIANSNGNTASKCKV
jgi:hypothetical protein